MAAVVLDHIDKVYPAGTVAVRDLSLEIADGELLVLVGPSGCGKTTTLRLIAGLDTPTAGTIRIDGRDVTGLPPRERDVAMVFQRPAIYPHLSVADNLAFGLRLQQPGFGPFRWGSAAGDISQRITEAARTLRLEELLDRRADQLSGGQQQRVALGRAVVRRPGVFLLDEPLSSLDSRLRIEMRRELHLLHRRFPATMIYVTHDPAEALALADRVAVLDDGTLQQADTPLTVYHRPCNLRVAGFFGTPPMNLVDGEIVYTDGHPSFQTLDGVLTLALPVEVLGTARPGQAVTLGVRPDHLSASSSFEGGSEQYTRGILRVRPEHLRDQAEGAVLAVVLVEPDGATSLVTLQRGDTRLTLVSDGAPVRDGEKWNVVVNMEYAHLFDQATGQALGHGSRNG